MESCHSSRSQSFTYDLLNRIVSAGTTATSGTYAWGYQFAYDNWGNLLAQAGWSPTYNGATETITSAVTADNGNHISAMTYDPSGNARSDGNYAYTWNGESEMKTAALPAGSPVVGTYTYDGDGNLGTDGTFPRFPGAPLTSFYSGHNPAVAIFAETARPALSRGPGISSNRSRNRGRASTWASLDSGWRLRGWRRLRWRSWRLHGVRSRCRKCSAGVFAFP